MPCSSPSFQILKHLQEQKDSQCLHVEEYQNLVKDLRMELEAVSEQKKNIMKGTPWAGGLWPKGGAPQGRWYPPLSKKPSVWPRCRNDEVGAGPARAAGGDICPHGEERQGGHPPAASAAGAADAVH